MTKREAIRYLIANGIHPETAYQAVDLASRRGIPSTSRQLTISYNNNKYFCRIHLTRSI